MRLPRRAILKRLWLVAVLAYTLLRAGVVGYFLADYGVNPWVYLSIDFTASIPFGYSSANLVELLASGTSGWRTQAAITAATYLAPDVYLMAALHQAPSHIYLITLAVIASLAAVSGFAILRRAKAQG